MKESCKSLAPSYIIAKTRQLGFKLLHHETMSRYWGCTHQIIHTFLHWMQDVSVCLFVGTIEGSPFRPWVMVLPWSSGDPGGVFPSLPVLMTQVGFSQPYQFWRPSGFWRSQWCWNGQNGSDSSDTIMLVQTLYGYCMFMPVLTIHFWRPWEWKMTPELLSYAFPFNPFWMGVSHFFLCVSIVF